MPLFSHVNEHKAFAALMGAAMLSGATVIGLSSSFAAQGPPNGAELATQYLAALTPAGAAIKTAETKLEKLPVTASAAQVKAIVAPVGPALSKIESLTTGNSGNSSGTSTVPPGGAVSLESLGTPVNDKQAGIPQCGSYQTGTAAHMVVGGQIYQDGFQVNVSSTCLAGLGGPAWGAAFTWRLWGHYRYLTAQVAPDQSGGCQDGEVRFLGLGYKSLPVIKAAGVAESVLVHKGHFQFIKVDISAEPTLTVQVLPNNPGFTCHFAVDFTNDKLS